ncbi:MAG: hypothetical protein EOM26_04090 [Alphaproteobacteria bacterium]|nr:hypothetical protein [Alphaproteobacteria bacterium]
MSVLGCCINTDVPMGTNFREAAAAMPSRRSEIPPPSNRAVTCDGVTGNALPRVGLAPEGMSPSGA